jgi:type IV pilus assembly protein PilV
MSSLSLPIRSRLQQGVMLIEVLIAIVIFAIGILAMIHLQAVSIAAQADGQYRVEAGHLIDNLIAQVRVNVARDANTGLLDTADLDTFQRNMTTTDACQFSGAAPTGAKTLVTEWIRTVRGLDASDNPIPFKGLPNGAAQIVTTTNAGISELRVTVCWQAPADKFPRSHTVAAYVD